MTNISLSEGFVVIESGSEQEKRKTIKLKKRE
jgi:hypothetical protein